MHQQKIDLICRDMVALFSTLPADAPTCWGRMNPQQIVEHLSAFFRVSTGKLRFALVTPEGQLPKFKAFLRSDKAFRENTKAPVLPEEPVPLQLASYTLAVKALAVEVADFFRLFDEQPGLTTQHPVFGDLDFEEWVLLHYKHCTHHLVQCGLLERVPLQG